MKVALYARVSTSDKDQDPETQLLPLREFALAQGWDLYREYVDHAPATDLAHRMEWRQLLDDASKRRFDVMLVWRMDRAFRSGSRCCYNPRKAQDLGGGPQVFLRALAGYHFSPR